MADIRINAIGDGSSGSSMLGELAEKTGIAAAKWELLGKAALEAAKEVGKFLVDSVKAYAETERVQRQLTRAAGEYAGQLEEQAQAMSKLYAIDDDVIMQGQTLLAQWGGAGAATEEVTKATLNLSSAMGIDLKTATEELIRNVESGGKGLGKMGIHFTETGDKGKDLAAAVAAINAKLGGAAATDAGTLTGSLNAIGIAFEDIKKGLGEKITQFLEWSGVIGRVTEALRGMNTALGIGDVADQQKKNEAYLQLQEHLTANLERRKQLMEGVVAIEARGEQAPKSRAEIAHLDENIAKLKEMIRLKNEAIGAGDTAAPGVTGRTNKGMREDESAAKAASKGKSQEELNAASLEDTKKYYAGLDQLEEHGLQKDMELAAAEFDVDNLKVANTIKAGDDQLAAIAIQVTKENKLYEKQVEERDKAAQRMLKEANDSNARAMEEQARQWAKMGDQIGAGFVSALQVQLDSMAKGGEFDVAQFMGDILATAAGIAGTAIGTYLGAPAVGAAVGNLAAMGIQAGFGSMSRTKSQRAAKKYHDGGWVGDEPRYHSGTWIGDDEQRAILQTGERVLSRSEVANAGGPRGVDAMAKGRGGPAVSVTIHAIDSKSAADSFASDLGRGMRQALRSGRGDLPALLGVRVR